MFGFYPPFALRDLSRPARVGLGSCVTAAVIAYAAALLMAYLEVTSPSSVLPDIREVDTAVFAFREKPKGHIERLLEASDGPMNGSGTMRPAFTEQSADWQSLTANITAEQRGMLISQREGERLALLDWLRSGASREHYERDDYSLSGKATVHIISAAYLVSEQPSSSQNRPQRVRIRSLLNDRCATCHSENGRNEKARWIPLDTYERLQFYCRPQPREDLRPNWLVASLLALTPLAGLTGAVFGFTSYPRWTRTGLTTLSFAALIVMVFSWLVGQPGTHFVYVLISAAAVATTAMLIQTIASLGELIQPATDTKKPRQMLSM